MPEAHPTNPAANALRETAKTFTLLVPEELARRELGQLGFGSELAEFTTMQAFMRRIATCSWNGVPAQIIQEVASKLGELNNPILRIKAFTVIRTGVDLVTERQRIVLDFLSKWQNVYSTIAPHLCYAEITDNQANQNKDALAKAVAQAEADIKALARSVQEIMSRPTEEVEKRAQSAMADAERAEKATEEALNRINTMAKDVEKLAQQSGVTEQTMHFKKLADNYRTGAILWLLVSIGAGVGLYEYVNGLNLDLPTNAGAALLAATVLPRLVIITLLSTALIFCIRNFSALFHNVIVNRHRQTALTTFKTFVNSTDDPSTRNAVLVQSTQAIFTPQPSGYLKTDTEIPQMSQITEIVRGVTGTDKG
jgi:ElaB/YqjD/DUF883 family membrane-anchored ribosome-binding protein